MTIWLEFPPNRLTAIRSAYLSENAKDGETVQQAPQVDATGNRMLVGTSRLTAAGAGRLANGNVPWLKVHTEFPRDWEYPRDG